MIAIVVRYQGRLDLRKGLANLLSRPHRCRIRGDRDVLDVSPIVAEEHQHE